jgi:hypothetical protein
MNMFQYFGVGLLITLSLHVGLHISSHTKEELKDGLKYFRVTSTSILFSLSTLFFLLKLNLALSILLGFITTMTTLFFQKQRSNISMIILGLIFSVFAKNTQSYVVPSLIMIHNVSKSSTIYYLNKNQAHKKILGLALIFLITITVSYFIA